MDIVINFLVDNYIWVLIISVFLIVVLIGYIADQRMKLKKIKEQENEKTVNNSANSPISDQTSNINVAPTPVVTEPINNVVSAPVNNVVTPIEQVSNDSVVTPVVESSVEQVNVVPTPVVSEPIVTEPINNVVSDTIENPTFEPIVEPIDVQTTVVEEPGQIESIVEEVPQTIINIPDNVADIPVQQNTIEEIAPINVETPIVEDTEIIEEPEIIEEIQTPKNIVNSWEPELLTENKDIINENKNEDSL